MIIKYNNNIKINLDKALADLDIARQIKKDELIANAIFIVAIAYLERERLFEASEALDEAAILCRKLGNKAGIAQIDLRLSDIAFRQGNAISAEKKALSAFIFFQEINDIAGQVSACERLSAAFCLSGRFEEAIHYINIAIAFLVKNGDKIGELLLRQRIAPLYRSLGQFSKALEVYEEIGLIAETLGVHEYIALSLVGIGTTAIELGRYKIALVALDKARILYSKLGQNVLATQITDQLTKLVS